jgi:hypothetical protein
MTNQQPNPHPGGLDPHCPNHTHTLPRDPLPNIRPIPGYRNPPNDSDPINRWIRA